MGVYFTLQFGLLISLVLTGCQQPDLTEQGIIGIAARFFYKTGMHLVLFFFYFDSNYLPVDEKKSSFE